MVIGTNLRGALGVAITEQGNFSNWQGFKLSVMRSEAANGEVQADPENHWIVDTMRALEDIGPEAKAATPALVQRLNHKDSVLRQVATEVLKKVNPEAASKAGMK